MHDAQIVTAAPSLLVQTPLMATVVVGLAVGWVRWGRHPRASLLATIALVLLLIGGVGSRLIAAWLVATVESARWVQGMIFVTGLGSNIILAAAVGLLLWAAFGQQPDKMD
jgi:hypothetical protein